MAARTKLSTAPSRATRRRTTKASAAELPDTISWWAAFYRVIRRIPFGRVCTYGAVAAMAGHPRAARHVGQALSALKETREDAGVPWQRVLGSRSSRKAAISIKDPVGGGIQRMLLEAEGVQFDAHGNISLDRFGWFQSTPVAAPGKRSRAPAATKKRAAGSTKKRSSAATKKRSPTPVATKKRSPASAATKKRSSAATKKRSPAPAASKKQSATPARRR